jgi:hypothetical protein
MFRPLKGHFQGVRTVTNTYTCMYTYSTSVHIQCEVIYDDTGVRDVNFMLSKVEVFVAYTYSFFGHKYDDCLHCYINSQVCLLDMFVLKYLGPSNCYIYMCLPHMQCGLGITCTTAL